MYAVLGDPSASGVRPLVLGAEWITSRAGGLNRYLAELVPALAQVGAAPEVVVIGPTPPHPMLHGVSDCEAPLPVRVCAVRHAAVRFGHMDVVDAHFALYAFLPLMSSSLRRLPLVVHFQGPWADESRVSRGEGRIVTAVKRAVERAVYRRAEIVVVLSAAFGRLIVHRYGVDPSRVEVVPPGVDLDRFRPGDSTQARARLGVDRDAFVVVSVRRLDSRMGLDILLDAWAIAQAQQFDAVLLVAGAGRERAHLERRCATLPHPERVRFLGSVTEDELVALYQAADCSVVPTRALEGFGLVTLESAACGTPPIVTDVGGLPDGVVDLDASLVVPGDDEAALARRLLAAADGELPDRAVTRIHAEQFSWEVVARRHLELYDRARGRRPLSVAFIGHTAELSGGELALARLLPALTNVNARVLLAEDGPLVARLRGDGVRVEIVPMGEASRHLRRDRVRPGHIPVAAMVESIRAVWRLTHCLRSERPDVVHTNTLKAALYGGVAGRLAGVPVVWHLRDRIAIDYLPAPAIRLVRLAARVLPTAVIGNSDATLATLKFGTKQRRIHDAVVPSPIPTAIDCPMRPDGIPFTVGSVGRLSPWKGQDLFLRAFASSFPTGDARARIVGSAMFGEDEWAEGLRRLAFRLGISERVDFVGFTSDVASEYARFDVFVHAAVIPEPFGQVVFEAMAAGLPVVVPDAGGPGELVMDDVDGLLYPMGDVEALASRLRHLASDGALRARLGEEGRRRIADFSPDKVAARVMEVYASVLSQQSHRRAH